MRGCIGLGEHTHTGVSSLVAIEAIRFHRATEALTCRTPTTGCANWVATERVANTLLLLKAVETVVHITCSGPGIKPSVSKTSQRNSQMHDYA
jgi:hypothetical protein